MADEFRGPDPFRREVKLNLESIYYPLGFPLELATNCAEINTAAAEIWGQFPQAFDKLPLRVRVDVEPGGPHPPAPVYRGREHLMIISADSKNFAVCDHTSNAAFCWLNSEAAGDRAFVSYYFLEAIANYSLTQLYLTPVHGACVARQGRGVLLCGPSGAGKSSLAYFCARNRWTYVSDNESWLVRAGSGRLLLGNPHRMRFRDSARDLFPELDGHNTAPDVNGKMSIAISLADVEKAFQCCVERVVFLTRQPSGPSEIRSFPGDQALRRFLSELPLYDPRIREQQHASLQRIAELNPVELRYSRLDDALRQLESLLT